MTHNSRLKYDHKMDMNVNLKTVEHKFTTEHNKSELQMYRLSIIHNMMVVM